MKAPCHNCGTECQLDPISMLCVDCLIQRSRDAKAKANPDFKQRQAGGESPSDD